MEARHQHAMARWRRRVAGWWACKKDSVGNTRVPSLTRSLIDAIRPGPAYHHMSKQTIYKTLEWLYEDTDADVLEEDLSFSTYSCTFSVISSPSRPHPLHEDLPAPLSPSNFHEVVIRLPGCPGLQSQSPATEKRGSLRRHSSRDRTPS